MVPYLFVPFTTRKHKDRCRKFGKRDLLFPRRNHKIVEVVFISELCVCRLI